MLRIRHTYLKHVQVYRTARTGSSVHSSGWALRTQRVAVPIDQDYVGIGNGQSLSTAGSRITDLYGLSTGTRHGRIL
jgi:predicted ATP-dependent protease